MTHCNTDPRVDFHPEKPVDLEFNAPNLSSDGGAVLVRQVDKRLGLTECVARQLPDTRDASRINHTRQEQLIQRVVQISMGWEDQNDADRLRDDPAYKIAADRQPDEEPLSAQSTLSHFENSVDMRDNKRILETLECSWISRLSEDRDVVVLDIDASAYEGHGQQELLAYCGFRKAHIHHPLFVMDGQTGDVISAILRPGSVGDERGAIGVLRRLIDRIKSLRADIDVVVRGDAGFAKPKLYRMLERRNRLWGGVTYVFGIAKNPVLNRKLEDATRAARHTYERTGRVERSFRWLQYEAKSWETTRSVVGKAEVGPQGENPRYVVTNVDDFPPRFIYDRAYCPRGDAENTVKSFKLHLLSERMSLGSFGANFFRLLQHLIAHRLLRELSRTCAREAERQKTMQRRRITSTTDEGNEAQETGRSIVDQLHALAAGQLDTLRLMLLKVAAQINQTTRRIHMQFPKSFPMAGAYAAVASRLDGY